VSASHPIRKFNRDILDSGGALLILNKEMSDPTDELVKFDANTFEGDTLVGFQAPHARWLL
jgi:hypothetical protein